MSRFAHRSLVALLCTPLGWGCAAGTPALDSGDSKNVDRIVDIDLSGVLAIVGGEPLRVRTTSVIEDASLRTFRANDWRERIAKPTLEESDIPFMEPLEQGNNNVSIACLVSFM